jgi:ATP-dependent RNA helicase HelY
VIDRVGFAAGRGVVLDPFQVAAIDALDAGRSVLVAAPTGSGKTLVAEYAIDAALARGAKAFYTTPLKALSNQKFTDFCAHYGSDRVGLLTGDHSIRGEAPIVVMTTEVLRNMVYADSVTLDDLGVVVLDEVHYLQDRFRGPVWEEVIVHLDHAVPLVCLSATVANAREVADWITSVRGATDAVVEERRPVALRNWYLVGERGRDACTLLPTFVGDGDPGRPNPEAQRLTRRPPGGAPRAVRGRLRTPTRDEVVDLLADSGLLPAIVFVFSRAGCDQAVEHARAAAVSLTSPEERVEIRRIAAAHTATLADDEATVLGVASWQDALEHGVAAHHAGLVPPLKEAVEAAFTAGLVKVVFATETLALGVNMPARTVVIEKLTKFTGERHEFLTPGEYTQLTGRAGRRGIDTVGNAVVLWSPFVHFDQVASVAARGSEALVSAFRPTYNMAANLVARYDRATAHRLLGQSFAQFRADRDVVTLERQLAAARDRLARARAGPGGPGASGAPGEGAGPGTRGAERGAVARALRALEPGDVVLLGRRATRNVVVGRDGRRDGDRVVLIDTGGDVRRLGPDDFAEAPVAVARITLPEPYAPKNAAFRRAVADAARRARVRGGAGPGALRAGDRAGAARARDRAAAAAAAVARAEKDVARLERRIRTRGSSLTRQFDQVLALLESWGYVEEWDLTVAGTLLARLSTEQDLLVAEALREGWLAGLGPPELAAVASCCTYERRGPDAGLPGPPLRWPSSRVADAARRLERRWRDLAAAEDDLHLPGTRPPDPGLTPAVFEWASGDRLADVLGDELTAGDFVRHVKQLIDVLRQIGEVSPDPGVRDAARAAVTACHRGVVATASRVGSA